MRSANVERAIAALAAALAEQEGQPPASERRFVIERGLTAFVENQLRGGTVVAHDPEDA